MAPVHGLVHAKEYDIKDSNVELIGSDIDHRVKYASAATEPAWNDGRVGVAAGLLVWRIEDFQVVAVPPSAVGIFYDGDSYIVLHSYRLGRADDADAKLAHEIFFWLGAHTTQDEAGTAAYKTVELDEFLQGAATQHRELQASPSAAFLAVFPRQLTIRRGGMASGFRHVDETIEEARASRAAEAGVVTLLRVFKQPGARTDGGIIVHEVSPTWQSLDDDDVFVADAGSVVYVWQGRHCSPMEKAKAADVAQDLRTPAHTGGVQVVAQDDGRAAVLVRLLGGGVGEDGGSGYRSPRPVGSTRLPSTATAQQQQMQGQQRQRQLWRLSDASGALSFELVKAAGSADLADFDSNDIFLWDDAGQEVWVWEGRNASAAERSQWLNVAQAYVRQLAAEDGAAGVHLTPLAKVRDGSESPGVSAVAANGCLLGWEIYRSTHEWGDGIREREGNRKGT